MEENGFRPIKCSSCGRFLGYASISDGELYLKCGKCPNWTVVLEGERELSITGKEIYERLEKLTKHKK